MAHGPFDTYTEVMTEHGVFGIPAGQVLTFKNGAAVLSEAKAAKAATIESDEAANAGNVADVLARVGDDAEAAAEVLAAEQTAEQPRTSLISGLEAIIAAAESEITE